MTNEQIANELRSVPDAALQQQATTPSVPGYLVASEIQRRIQARNPPQQQGAQQNQPTLLAQMAKNLAPPQQPMVNNSPPQPLSPVPAQMLHQNPTPAQHFDYGGYVPRERYDGEDGSYVPPDDPYVSPTSVRDLPGRALYGNYYSPVDPGTGSADTAAAPPPKQFDPSTLPLGDPATMAALAGDSPAPLNMPSASPAVRRALQMAASGQATPAAPPPKQFDPSTLPPEAVAGPAPKIEDAPARSEVPVWSQPAPMLPPPTAADPASDAPVSDTPTGASVPDANGVSTLPSGLKQRPPGVDRSASAPWSEQSPLAGISMPGAYGPAASTATGQTSIGAVPQTSTSPLQNPPNTHQGGSKFFQIMKQLAPVFSYVGNVGAGASMPGGNLGTGVGFANQQQAAANKEKAAQVFQQQELLLKQQDLGMNSQKLQMEALNSGAKFIGPNGKIQEPMVSSPGPTMINGVPMGAPSAPIPGSGAVPANPQMTTMTGAPGYGGKPMDYSDMLTQQKSIELAQQNKYAQDMFASNLRIGEHQAEREADKVSIPPGLAKMTAQFGFAPDAKVAPATLDSLLKITELKPGQTPYTGERLARQNSLVAQQYNISHPGEQVPSNLVLQPGATPDDGAMVESFLKSDQAIQDRQLTRQQIQSNQATVNAMHRESIDNAAQNHADAMEILRGNVEEKKTKDVMMAADKFVKPYQEANKLAGAQAEKIGDAYNMLNSGSAPGIAVGAPKILAALVSGAGSGVRITQSELNALGKARGITGDVEAYFRNMTGKGNFSPDQIKQYSILLNQVKERLQNKMRLADAAQDDIRNSKTLDEQTAKEQLYRHKMSYFEQHSGERVFYGTTPPPGQLKHGDIVDTGHGFRRFLGNKPADAANSQMWQDAT